MKPYEAEKLLTLYPHLKLIDKLHIYIRLRRAYFDIVEQYVPKKGKILDFGCGHGFFSFYLYQKSQKREIIGTDISEKKIAIAKTTSLAKYIRFIRKDTTLDLLGAKHHYEAITILNVLYLFDRNGQKEVIKKASASLQKNGTLILIDHDANITFMTFYTRLREFLMFRVLRLTTGSTLTFNTHEWWMDLLKQNFQKVDYISLDKRGFQKLYICKK